MWEKDAGPAGTMEADWHEATEPGAPCANDWAAPSMQPIPGDTHNRLENTEARDNSQPSRADSREPAMAASNSDQDRPMLPAGSRDWMSPL